MNKLLFTLIVISCSILTCCNSVDPNRVLNESNDLLNARWITDAKDLPLSDYLFYKNNPAPIFRKKFKTSKEVVKAKLLITAAGYYKAYINGETIGKNELDPAWTDFSKRIYFTEYDISASIKNQNCLTVALGNGFYNPLPLRKWGRRNLRKDTKVGKPTFIAKLIIHYKDGTTDEYITDKSWKFSYGPLSKNSVYLGVVYDANNEKDHWKNYEFDDANWDYVALADPPGGNLQRSFFPPVQVTDTIIPTEIYSPVKGTYIVDMGINFTGTYNIILSGKKNDTVVFRFGERIYEDGQLNPMTSVIGQIKKKGIGGPGAPDIAWQTDSFIFGDSPDVTFKPEFTYHTFRYMEITGLRKKPELLDIKGLALNSNVSQINSFECSSELLNEIQQATLRTYLSNLVSVQSDCPAREKFGYGGDINATSESFIYNFDMKSFYRKTVYDWVDAMKDSSFVDTAPYTGIEYCGISWESAYLTTQYYLYLYYGDIDFIKEMYPKNLEWMEKAARIHPEGIVNEGLSDHESLQFVPVQLTGTSHYLQCAQIMKLFASIMNDDKNEAKFEKLSIRLKNILKSEFWQKEFLNEINKQTLFSTLLYHNIVPENEVLKAKDSLRKAILNGPNKHFNTGIFGTKYVLESNDPDLTFDVVNSTLYPGWGHMIDKGATTIWETWKESDNTYSNNHPMFGSVSGWFYSVLAGIKPNPDFPGFKKFVLSPFVPEDLEYVKCNYESPFGRIVSNWKKIDRNTIIYEFIIPESTEAVVTIDLHDNQIIQLENSGSHNKSPKMKELQSGIISLSEGSYSVTVLTK